MQLYKKAESSRDVSVLDLVTEVPLGVRSEGVSVTWWKRGVSCLTARKTPQIDNCDKAALGSALTRLQLFPVSYTVG